MKLTTKTKIKIHGEWMNITRIDNPCGTEWFTLNNNVNAVSREYIEANTTETRNR